MWTIDAFVGYNFLHSQVLPGSPEIQLQGLVHGLWVQILILQTYCIPILAGTQEEKQTVHQSIP